MNICVIPQSTLSRGEIAAIVGAVSTSAEFKRLGDRIPTPPPSDIHPYPEETKRLAEIASERVALVAHQKRIQQRGRYATFAQERRSRVLEELKNGPETGKVTTICGFDVRLSLDDKEWDEWCAGEGKEVFEKEEIPGREGVCIKKNCRTHKGWALLFTEEQGKMERERLERVMALKQEERNIRERQKRRAVKDESEGLVEVEG
jgi:COMPASS component SPP1